jgi:hypothetical protein
MMPKVICNKPPAMRDLVLDTTQMSGTRKTEIRKQMYKVWQLAVHRCGYQVSGMILLRDLHEAMRREHNKVIFAHVLTCTSYDLNVLTPGV